MSNPFWRSPSGLNLSQMRPRLVRGEFDGIGIPDVEAYRAWFTGLYIRTGNREGFEKRVALVAAYYAHFEVCDVGEV